MNNIIIPTGYMGSGSSAITDLVSEFKGCRNDHKSFEYVFLHCPDGLFDLEDKLLQGNNAIRSDEAIRSFEHQMKKLYNKKYWWVGHYQKIIGPEFWQYTEEYITSLTNFQYPGYWYMHEDVNFKMFLKLLMQKPLKIITRGRLHLPKVVKYSDGMRICLPSPEEFYAKSRDYLKKILYLASGDSENIILDQLVLPFNLFRFDNYFEENARCIVVERDPRDLYVLNKYIWGKKNSPVPIPVDVYDFCEYYRRMRTTEKPCNSDKVLRVRFENLVYRYDESLREIMNFLGFSPDDHIHKKERFNPELSIRNTQVFHNPCYAEEVSVIEKELAQYLYEFPYDLKNSVENSIEFE